jgi:transglutaminase-like putative cysteine protease
VELHPVWESPEAIAETWIPNLPGEALRYLYPSRYCESDLLAPVAHSHFGAQWQGYSRAAAICEWVRTSVQFTSGSSVSTTTASHTLASGRGVCRDFAHLMIAMCRALNIPARFVTGVDFGADPALGPTDFHAYVEAYLGGRWYIFDPSGTAIPMGFIRLTSGSDAADCAYASIFGDVVPLGRQLSIEVAAGPPGVTPVVPYRTDGAISTAAS